MAFDPELNLLYIGTGNGSPWSRSRRSPAGGDNLYRLRGRARPRHRQVRVALPGDPGDNWDYTSTQPMIPADLQLDGQPRKVILHAPKNGFFFVIDRTNGKFISAGNFVDVNWASGYDKDGRPIELPAARDGAKPYDAIPALRRAQLAPDVVQPADRVGLPAGPARAHQPDRRQELDLQRQPARPAARQPGLEHGSSSMPSRPRASPSAA